MVAGSTTQRLPLKKAARMGDEGKGAGFHGTGAFAVLAACSAAFSDFPNNGIAVRCAVVCPESDPS
jgi:hypothetical protein